MRIYTFILLCLLFWGCKFSKYKSNQSAPVAKVYEHYLYASEIAGIIPAGLSPEDSLTIVKDYVDKWIRNRLLLYQAEQNLLPEDKNVERQIEDYRNSLLIFKYEQNYITQKLDTTISAKAIEDYYNTYSSNFILNNNLIKGVFIKVPRIAPQIYKLQNWYRSDNPEYLKEMEHYCYNYASKYLNFEDDWRYFNEIARELPVLEYREDNLLRFRKYYEVKDSTYYYFLKISDYKLEGSTTPLELIRGDIRSILVNKKKIRLIEELETKVYNDALNRGNFIVYE